MKKIYDVAYGSRSASQKLDLYLPDSENGAFPLVVFIHGGGFYSGDKQDGQEQPWITLTKYGYAVASLNYRLSTEAKHPAGILDCKQAVRFLRANADRWQVDGSRIAVSGGSSGAHYAMMVALTVGNPEFHDSDGEYQEQPESVCCVVSWYGGLDLAALMAEAVGDGWKGYGASFAISNMERYLGKKLTDGNDRELAEASPVSYIHPGMPPILLQHGSSDELAPCSQSEIFYDRAKKAAGSGQIEFDILKGYRHADVRFGDHGNMKRVREFLDRYMKQRGEA